MPINDKALYRRVKSKELVIKNLKTLADCIIKDSNAMVTQLSITALNQSISEWMSARKEHGDHTTRPAVKAEF